MAAPNQLHQRSTSIPKPQGASRLTQNLNYGLEGVERSECGDGYPLYVEKEYRDFIGCGDLSRGFARVRCQACRHEFLLPFSCKNRGICPSCTTRRMSDEAAYLADMVLPEAPYRQWTLTFPWTMRYLMAKDYKLITAILGVAMRILFAWQRRVAKKAPPPERQDSRGGPREILVQRFGGALNLNVHFHVLLPDAVDVLDCPRCLGPMTVLACLTDPPVLAKILTHLGLPDTSPALAPARRRGQLDLFDESGDSWADESIDSWGDPPHEVRPGPSRDPPTDERDFELDERRDTGAWGA